MTKQDFFFWMLRSAISQQPMGEFTMTPYEYKEIFELAEKQGVVGLIIECLVNNQVKLKKKCVIHMMKMKNSLIKKNKKLNERAVEIGKLFDDAGFNYCIIKGQGNNLMYPNPMSRTPGDIDIWVKGSRKQISNFIKEKCPDARDGRVHIDFPFFEDAVVEVHYTPSVLSNPISNKRLQKWIKENAETQYSHKVNLPETEGTISIPTPEFNIIQQLAHIMSHFFIEGIGLRQFVDYYFVLKKARHDVDYEKTLRQLGLLRFAQGVMWVEKSVFEIEDDYLITKPNEKIGKLILNEIVEGGNFGRHDERYASRKSGYLARGATDVVRLLKLSSTFPSEALWGIGRKIINQKWKI